MFQLITVILSAGALSAAAQELDWAYMVCIVDLTEDSPAGEAQEWREVRQYRFTDERVEWVDPEAETWVEDCVEGGGYFAAQQSISQSEIRCIRAGTNEGGGELYYDVSINRLTGDYTLFDYSYVNGAATSRNGTGHCRLRRVPAPTKQP